ncbi:MAG: methyltransferase domain-containing protein [Pirellulales bacterium]
MTSLNGLADSVSEPFSGFYGDAEKLVQIVSEVTGLSPTETTQRLLTEYRNLGTSVWRELQERRITPYQWTDELTDFYASTNAFVFESIVWNRCSLKQGMRCWIADFLKRQFSRPLRVLVFGDGLGFDSAFLALAGHQVSYFEVSRKAVQFAQQLFAATKCDVEMLTDVSQIREQMFDVVVCLDVMEHVPDPPGTVELLVAALTPHGQLIVHSPFWYLSPKVGTHLAANRRFSGDVRRLYKPYGLTPVDSRWFWDPLALARITTDPQPKLSTRLRLGIGSWLLSVGRLWSWPHVMIVERMLTNGTKEWPALERLANEPAALS